MTSLLNFIKIYQLVQKLLGGPHRQTDRQTDGHADTQTDRQAGRQTDRQTGDLISLTFLFEESRLKMGKIELNRLN
jgi:hypothetical protein